MSLNEDRMAPRSSAWRSVRLVTVTTAVVFAGLAIVNALAVGYAVAGFVIVVAVAFLTLRSGAEVARTVRPVGPSIWTS